MLRLARLFAILLSAALLYSTEVGGSDVAPGGLSIRDQPSITTIVLGGPASTTLYGGVETYIEYSATAPAVWAIPVTSISYGGIATPTRTWTDIFPSGISSTATAYQTVTGYYTVLKGSTYYANDPVPLSIWAPSSYPCPTGFANYAGTCRFCPAGFYAFTDVGNPRYYGACQPMTVYTPPCDGYYSTNAEGASSCVPTATMTTSCNAGYSTYAPDKACVSGTNVDGRGPSLPTLGGPATTITEDGIPVTEYSVTLISYGRNAIDYWKTLYGSPTTTFTIGGGSTTSTYRTCIATTPCTYQDYFPTVGVESLGSMTVTEYQSIVVPYVDVVLPSSSTLGGGDTGSNVSSSAAAAASGPSTEASNTTTAVSGSSTAASGSTTAVSSPAITASSPSTAPTSSASKAVAGHVSLDLVALSMAGACALGALVAL